MQKNINLSFDKRLEVLSVLYYLTDYIKEYASLVCTDEKSLYKKVLDYFEPYKNHEAVQAFNRLFKEEAFDFDAPINLFLQFYDDFSGYQLRDNPYKKRLHSSPLVIELMEATMKFYKDTDFERFYQSNQVYYENVLNQSIDFDIDSVFKFMKTYYGNELENHKFEIILMSGTANGNFAIGFSHTHICVTGVMDGTTYIDTSTVLHEFSHPIINPLVEKYIPTELINDPTLFMDINEHLRKIGYGTNINNLQE